MDSPRWLNFNGITTEDEQKSVTGLIRPIMAAQTPALTSGVRALGPHTFVVFSAGVIASEPVLKKWGSNGRKCQFGPTSIPLWRFSHSLLGTLGHGVHVGMLSGLLGRRIVDGAWKSSQCDCECACPQR